MLPPPVPAGLVLGPAVLAGTRLSGFFALPSDFLSLSFLSSPLPSLEGVRSDLPPTPPVSALLSLSILANCSLGILVGGAGGAPATLEACLQGVTETGLVIEPFAPGSPNSTAPRKVTTWGL